MLSSELYIYLHKPVIYENHFEAHWAFNGHFWHLSDTQQIYGFFAKVKLKQLYGWHASCHDKAYLMCCKTMLRPSSQ